MSKIPHIYFFGLSALIILFVAIFSSGCRREDSNVVLLSELDATIADRAVYHDKKEKKLQSLRDEIRVAAGDEQRFHAMGHLLDEYMSYNTDSALAISNKRIVLADKSGNEELKIHALLSQSHVLSLMGMYKEAIDYLTSVPPAKLPQYLRPYYYHINRTIYGFMADYAVDDREKAKYTMLVDVYRDSLTNVNPDGSFYNLLGESDGLNSHGRPAEAVRILEEYLDKNKATDHEKAIAAYTLSEAYRILGDTENEKRQLIISAINDMKTGVKEYVSLRELALLLYEEGDVKHAYDYLNICLADAQECNARLRILEINDVFPVVNSVYLDTIAGQQKRLRLVLVLVCLMVMILLAAVYYIYKEKKRVEEARRLVSEMNDRLNGVNDDLKNTNHRLVDANRAIRENSRLKEEFIAQYMDRCVHYIDKIDKYRKAISRAAATKHFDDLKKMEKNLPAPEIEARAFYENFDDTFLKLFPTFVKDFNALLRPEEVIIPKNSGKLNTELRIFALIRLGIVDSVKIAQFLRYSIATIYNYRTRVRNKAAGDRDKLEEELMKIGVSH